MYFFGDGVLFDFSLQWKYSCFMQFFPANMLASLRKLAGVCFVSCFFIVSDQLSSTNGSPI